MMQADNHTTSIQLASSADVDDIVSLLHRSIRELCIQDHENEPDKLNTWLANKTPENVATWVHDPHALCIVALSAQKQVTGFSMMSNVGEILLCYVLPEQIGHGVGRAMLEAMEQQARSQGLEKMLLESTYTAQSFYQISGFELTGGCAVRGPCSCLQMEKSLIC